MCWSILLTPTETLEAWEDPGKLNGTVDQDWIYWDWQIPDDAPLGDYTVRMSVWNAFDEDRKEQYRSVNDTFRVVDPGNGRFAPSLG